MDSSYWKYKGTIICADLERKGKKKTMHITKGYQKHPLTGEVLYPCEMYQTANTEQKEEQQTGQKSDEEET